MEFKVVCLGTASTIPSIKKNHSGYLIKTERENILLDCGEGIQRQFKMAKENASKLTKVLITHWHEDHSIGLIPLVKSLGMGSYSQVLQIYGPKHTQEKLNLFESIYARPKIRLDVKEVNQGVAYEDKQIRIESHQVDHGILTFAYSVTIKEVRRINKSKIKKLKLPSSPLIGDLQRGKDIVFNGKKIKSKDVTYMQPAKKLTIILDTAMHDHLIDFAKDSDLLVCGSTFASEEEEQAREYKHLTVKQAATIAKKAKAKRLALVHISEKHSHHHSQFLKEAKKVFKNSIIPNDLDVLEV